MIADYETGKGARPIKLEWVRPLIDETKQACLPFFIKQLGSDHKHGLRELDDREWNEFPEGFEK